ncbi:MAG: hypothetical protein V4501_00095 [Pseudomonadota bacterium]
MAMAAGGLTAVVEGGELILMLGWAGCREITALRTAHKAKELKEERDGVQKVATETIEKTDLPKLFDKEFNASFLTTTTLDSLITATPTYENKYLDQYVRHVMNALGYIYQYHRDRLREGKKIDDITSSVLSWAVLYLSTKCVNVTEHDKVFNYLQQISAFLNKFSSIKDKTSFRFQKLTRVVSEIDKAAYLLKDHSLSLSLMERTKQVLSVTSTTVANLFTAVTKALVPNTKSKNHWEYLQAFMPEQWAQGILQYHMTYKRWWGTRNVELPLIKLPKSKLSTYIQTTANDYLRALNLDGYDDSGDFIDPNKFKIEDFINSHEFPKAFEDCENFLTMKAVLSDGTNQVNKLVPITAEDLQNRLPTIIGLFQLIHCLNVLRYFARKLRDRLIEVGERYYNAPEETMYMFNVIEKFRNFINVSVDEVQTQLSAIKAQQQNAMLPAGLGADLYTEINNRVSDIKTLVSPALTELVNLHQSRLSHRQGDGHNHEHGSKPVRIHKNDPMLLIPKTIATKYKLTGIEQKTIQGDVALPRPELTAEQTLYDYLCRIHTRIGALSTTDRRIDKYREVYLALLMIFAHSLKMGAEKYSDRLDKSQHLLRLLLKQCTAFDDFLNKTPLEREADTHTFVSRITATAKDPDNKFIDTHNNKNSYLLVGLFKNTFINTQSRNEINELVETCERLQLVR